LAILAILANSAKNDLLFSLVGFPDFGILAYFGRFYGVFDVFTCLFLSHLYGFIVSQKHEMVTPRWQKRPTI